MARLLYAFILSVLASATLVAQTGEIQGKVVDETGEGIPFANVAVYKDDVLKTGTATDFDGLYSVPALEPGNYSVEASYQGNKVKVDGIVVTQSIIFMDDITVSSAIQLEDVVIKWEAPLVDRGNTSSGGVVTKEDIKNIPTRDISTLAATKAAVYQSDEGGGLNIKGSRGDATEYIIDGIRVRGSLNLPQSSIEQLEVITGGVEAKYGDATGGFVTITTRGPSRQYNGEFEVITSQFLDDFNYNLANAFITGPIIRQHKGTDSMRSKLGFFVAAEFLHQRDPDPAALDNYQVRDDIFQDIRQNPLRPSPTGGGFVKNAEFLTLDDLETVGYKLNTASDGLNITAKFDYQLGKFTTLTFGGNWRWFRGNEYFRNFSLFNAENNPQSTQNTYRGYLRFTQRFPERKSEDGSSSILGNAYYSIQASYQKFTTDRGSSRHNRNPFDYAYIGQFQSFKEPVYVYGQDSLTGLSAWQLVGYRDTLTTFTPGTLNEDLSQYTSSFYDLSGGAPSSLFDVQLGGGLLNGDLNQNTTVYSLYYNTGVPWFNYSYSDNDQFNFLFNAALALKNNNARVPSKHNLEFGFEFEQRIDRFYGINPFSLWTIMRQLTNRHISNLDTDNPMLVIDGQMYTYDEFLADPSLQFGQFDTIFYNRDFVAGDQSFFDQSLRDRMNSQGLAGAGALDFIDIDNLPADFFSLDMFSPDELLNNGNQLVFYNGYDYLGNKSNEAVSWNDFWTERDANGNFSRQVDAFRPIYSSAYVQDRFNFNDIIFRVGVRVDRYDANRKVLKDDYSLYDARSANEVDPEVYQATYGSDVTSQPNGIGDDFMVYVDDPNNSTPTILGYRDGRTWYNAAGEQVQDPFVIGAQAASNYPTPYLVNPNDDIKSEDFDPNSTFVDYEPQITVMPRIAFSFPISKEEGREALFFAHYDVLAQRPQARSTVQPYDYYFLQDNQGPLIDNPNLRPERTIDYQVGFQQQISDNSVVKLSAFYRELRDMVQIINVPFAWPIQYTTYGNIDFGTVKGMTFSYEIARRVQNIKLDASYTLQFADGTGSGDRSQVNLVGAGQPNLRTIIPLNYDSRHNIKMNIDYRYASGENYTGPRVGNSDIFSNAGLNLQLSTRSGEPFSRQTVATPDAQFGVAGRSNLDGAINGSRLPWHFRADLKVDKSFYVGVGESRELGFNVYFWVQNLFNNRNIISVYPFTGNPEDDGYLSSAVGIDNTSEELDPQSFVDLYGIKVANPSNYSLPRRMRIGISMSF